MPLLFMGKDPKSQGGNCPTVLVDAETFDLVIQGTRADSRTVDECGEFGSLPVTEAVVRLPARMVPLIREACDVAERRGL